MKDNRSFWQRFATWFGIGALMFGTYCGGSSASGTYATAYMVPYGGGYMLVFCGIFCLFMTFFCTVSLDFIRSYKLKDFNEFSLALYGADKPNTNPVYKKAVSIFFDIYNVLSAVVSAASTVALFGELMNYIFGMSKIMGGLVGVVVFTLLTVRGSGFLRKYNTIMTISLVACLLILLTASLGLRGDIFLERLGNFEIGLDWSTTPLNDQLPVFLSFCFLTCTWGGTLCNFAEKIKTKGDAIASGIMIGLLVTSIHFMTSSIVLPFLPEMFTATPILGICQQYFPKVLTAVYWIVVLFSVCSTAPTFAFNIANRYTKVWKTEKISQPMKFFIIGLVFMLACFATSTFGLMAIALKGYSFLGKIGGFAFGIPLVISIYRVHKKDHAEAAAKLDA